LVFVVGSGRCGTAAVARLLQGIDGIEAHHEYVRDTYQREATLYYMGMLDKPAIMRQLSELYRSAVNYSEAETFLDASNKLAWVVDVLAEAFPYARFIHLIRDGRKVVSSFFHKLNVYSDRHQDILREYKSNLISVLPPPPEEFWWPLAPEGYNQFQRICWHWVASNENILKHIPGERSIRVKLESLAARPAEMERMLSFIGIPFNNSFMEAMKRPQHVYVPVDYPLTAEQKEQFLFICAPMMEVLNYDIDEREYRVHYQM
jgi:hypothetical protein